MPVQLENYIVVSDMFKTRLRLDCYASFVVSLWLLKDKYKRTHHDFSVGLLGFVVWCIAVHKAKTQKDYMSIHPYVGLAVLPAATSAASWFIRNIGQSSLLLWVGKIHCICIWDNFTFFLRRGFPGSNNPSTLLGDGWIKSVDYGACLSSLHGGARNSTRGAKIFM